MRRLLAVALSLPFVTASAIAGPAGEPLDHDVAAARAEQAAAEAEVNRFERAARQAHSDADRLRAEQSAAAEAINAAESRITAAEANLRLAAAQAATQRSRLAAQQQPASALLAGLAIMARRPPLLALADGGGTDEMVKVRVLLDSTLPVIRRRTSALAAQIESTDQLEAGARAARSELVGSRRALIERRAHFAALEKRALQTEDRASGGALAAGDTALAAGEMVAGLAETQRDRQRSATFAAQLARDDMAPLRPFDLRKEVAMPPFAYALPTVGTVTAGLGTISPGGVRSRGLTIASSRGAVIRVPAAGTVRFAGPYRDYDGVLIIDHGHGWISVLLNVGSSARVGDRVSAGQEIGRALGPVGVELSHNGRRYSPALIAGSSQSLSKEAKGG